MNEMRSKTVAFEGEIDDTITILIKQKTSEFVLIHNNITDCRCSFCKQIMKSILWLWKKDV